MPFSFFEAVKLTLERKMYVVSLTAILFTAGTVVGWDTIKKSGIQQVAGTTLMLERYDRIFYSKYFEANWKEDGGAQPTVDDCVKFCTGGRPWRDRKDWKCTTFNYCSTPPCPGGKDTTKKHCLGLIFGINNEKGIQLMVALDKQYNHYCIQDGEEMVDKMKQEAVSKVETSRPYFPR